MSEQLPASSDEQSAAPASPGGAAPETSPPAVDPSASSEDRTLALMAHLLGILTWFIGALVIWLFKKEQSAFVDDQGREALNFQVTIGIGYLISIVATCATLGLGWFLAPMLSIVNIIFCVLAGIAAYNGQRYRYPFCLRLVK